jgi:hypothetical protein
VGGADQCATPDPSAGSGPFSFDNSAATMGAEGQLEPLCLFLGSTAIARDVWFTWTAHFTGEAELISCGHAVDTKIAVYAGAGCPTGPALACNDDYCGQFGYQSRLLFQAVQGQSYTIQLGLYPFGAPGGQGTFSILPALAPANDECASPAAIAGLGLFPFDTSFATTGTQGQNNSACNVFGVTGIDKDVWFDWTAPSTGRFVLDTCGGTVDTKIAVYRNGGCPTLAPLACNDTACGQQSRVIWTAVVGQVYSFQIGSRPMMPGGAGWMRVSQPPAHDVCSAPIAIAGTGTFPFDGTLATNGAEGQTSPACLSYGTTSISNDLWFAWTSDFSGPAELLTCGSSIDTKVAVYDGLGCPSAPALDCNDDFCGSAGFQSRIVWPAVAGQVFAIQLGTHPFLPASGMGTFQVRPFVPPVNDGCAAPAAVSGPGPHAFDLSTASTGAEGQANLACQFFGSSAIKNDVWFTWTAAISGTHVVSLCDGSTLDTKIAIYAGAGCPSAQALACNDDACFLTSELCFDAAAGQTYLIQIGLHPLGGALGGAGSFRVLTTSAGVGHDECGAPLPITGLGPFTYDNTQATTGCQGQQDQACSAFGQTGIARDLWFAWTAPTTDRYQISNCGTNGSCSPAGCDTKLAVYAGTSCPSTPALACDDDGCDVLGGASQVCFDATAGQTYLVQLGSYPGSPGGPGSFRLSTASATTGCQHDNGVSEFAYGLPSGGELGWLHRFGAPGVVTAVQSVSAAFGSFAIPGSGPPTGTPVRAAVWDDPDDDGNPANAVLLQVVQGSVSNRDNDQFDTFTLAQPITVSGYYFVGVALLHAAGVGPAALDQNGCPAGSAGRAWVVGSTSGALDLAQLSANNVGLNELDLLGFPGVWLLRANCSPAGITPYCSGDGTSATCPCGNFSTQPGTGCQHSFSVTDYAGAGARIGATGVPSLAADTLRLQGTQLPPSTACLFVQGTTQTATVFGDGLRCVGGTNVRLGLRQTTAGAIEFGAGVAGDPSVSSAGLVPVPGARYYMLWFRNAAPFCTPAGFNLSNGLWIQWAP